MSSAAIRPIRLVFGSLIGSSPRVSGLIWSFETGMSMYPVVPQSSARMITSWATSTSRRVR